MNLLERDRRNSLYSLLCAAVAAGLAVAAGRSFQNSDGFHATLQPYVTAPFRWLAQLNPFRAAPPQLPMLTGRSVFELSESESLFVVLYFAAVGAVAGGVFAWRASKRHEPSHFWAFGAILSLLAVIQLTQLTWWCSARWGW